MALSRDATNTNRPTQKSEFQVVNAEVIYGGSLMQLNGPLDGTAASRGRADVYNDENDAIAIGWALEGATGDTAANPIVSVGVGKDARILERVTIAGATGVSSVGSPVYATDDNTFTLTRPTLGDPIGFVARWHTGTTADLFGFSVEGQYIKGLAGGNQEMWLLGIIAPLSSAGNLLTGIEATGHARITRIYTIVAQALTGAGGSSTINAEIGGTNITGGVVTLTTAAGAAGTKAAGTAITAANVVHEGDLIDIEMALGVGFTGGLVNVYAEVERLPGL